MFTRSKLDAIWSQFIAPYSRDYSGKLVIKAPTVDGADGYSLWGGSIQQVSFNHLSGSRSGESHIVVVCMPNTDGEHDENLFAVSHFHHEGSSRGVETVDGVTQKIKERSEELGKMVEQALANPTLLQIDNKTVDAQGRVQWPDSSFFFNMASYIYCISMDVEVLSIMKAYNQDEELPKPSSDESLQAMQHLLSVTTDAANRAIIQEEINKRIKYLENT